MQSMAVLRQSVHVADEVRTVANDSGRGLHVSTNFDALFDAEYDGLVRVAYLMLGNNEQAEEAVQDAFVTVYRRWDDLQNPGGFARTAVVNRCRDLLRRGSNERRVLRLVRRAEPAGDDDYLFDVLRTLDAERRSMIVLRFYAGMTVPEIAETLGIAEGTVKSGIHRSLATMRKELER